VTDLLGATLAEQAAAVRGRRVSAVELTRAYLARIDAHDGALGAYLARDDEPALAAAAAVDAAPWPRRRPSAARRRAVAHQGHDRHARPRHHRGLEDARRLGPAVRRHRR
jgi:hypothetical protein